MLAGLAALVICPNSAKAACGDYVMIRGQHRSSGHEPMGGAVHGIVPTAQDADGTDSEAGSVPKRHLPTCQGPHCSNNSVPPPAPAPKIESTLERWACSTAANIVDSHQSSGVFAEPDVVLTPGIGLSILRPPR